MSPTTPTTPTKAERRTPSLLLAAVPVITLIVQIGRAHV